MNKFSHYTGEELLYNYLAEKGRYELELVNGTEMCVKYNQRANELGLEILNRLAVYDEYIKIKNKVSTKKNDKNNRKTTRVRRRKNN